MNRLEITPRSDWPAIVEAQGFQYHSNGARPEADTASNWCESVYYQFSASEVDEIERATAELNRVCLAAVDHIVSANRMDELGIPLTFQNAVSESWRRRDPSIYGRFDLAYNGSDPPKLLEFNADTPTALIESAIVQWYWLGDRYPQEDQFNGLHEMLVGRWREIGSLMTPGAAIHFSSIKISLEEFSTVEYLRGTAQEAGLSTDFIYIEDIGFCDGKMVDLSGHPIRYWFKLYPWEWLAREKFGPQLAGCLSRIGVIEPPWKMVLSNKGILPILWQLFPEHPNLLAADWHPLGDSYVEKPIYGREGKNIAIHCGGTTLAKPGPYGDERKVYQAIANLPYREGQFSVIGSWIVGDKPAGMCVREDEQAIIVAESRIVPHVLRKSAPAEHCPT